ncbi:protein tyrosine phosphatase [Companilactobacillus tucceti DSM 20183]|uniref:protein-tyrosine-phosphatase n=1 Tax=Companilactobacillus tucceti DSM 20183 TaxID=1423811 RepID=A0A0R1J2C5_9LACO|nr:low molecular weight protein-tyrosine-phosphatase [Companilactobacillus tucceti]KRK65461.1 protein tyrosine phosphatase [Companilactobacillus tucceti DSM 20183]
MKNIIFVCLGNICRSPMAEMMMREYIAENNLNNKISVSSRATEDYESGNPMHPGAVAELNKHSVQIVEHHSQKISQADFSEADLIIGMDHQNIIDLRSMTNTYQDKIHLALEFMDNKEIQDPWYDHKFDRTYSELSQAIPYWTTFLLNSIE